MAEFSCTSRLEDDLVVIDVVGDIDDAVADQLWNEISKWLTPGGRVVLDCSRVRFCDSMGLQVLLRAHKRAAALDDAAFALASLSEPMFRVLGLTKEF